MISTITLNTPMPFHEALQAMLDGKCLGIRPGNNTNYIELYKPSWMNDSSPDFMLRWKSHDDSGDSSIRSNQYLENWYAVIVNHRQLQNNSK